MIVGKLLEWLGDAVAWLGSLFTLPDPPAFFADLAGWAATVGGFMGATSVWIPWTLLVAVIGVWAACLLVAVGLKLGRIVASFVTLGGGSAA